MLTDEGVTISCPEVQFCLSPPHTMEPSEVSALYDALRCRQIVLVNSYSYRRVGYHGAIAVSVGLQLNLTLLQISLSFTSIGESGAAAIAVATVRKFPLLIFFISYD
jgi:hypothetical protein